MNPNIEDWPLTRAFEDLTPQQQVRVCSEMGEELYRAMYALHRQMPLRESAQVKPLDITKDKLDAAFKARYASVKNQNSPSEPMLHAVAVRPGFLSWRFLRFAAVAIVLLSLGYSLGVMFAPNQEPQLQVREPIRYVDRPVHEVEYRTVYVDRPVVVYEQLPVYDSLPLEHTTDLVQQESGGTSLAGDSLLQNFVITLN